MGVRKRASMTWRDEQAEHRGQIRHPRQRVPSHNGREHATGRFRNCARCDRRFETTTRRVMTCAKCFLHNSDGRIPE